MTPQGGKGLEAEGSLYRVTLHDLRGLLGDLTTYHRAPSITLASHSTWAAIPKDDQYNWSVSVEYVPPAPPAVQDASTKP